MTVLHSVDFFHQVAPVAIEPRLPQAAFLNIIMIFMKS